jgi:uncharacterized protein YjbI with pentapeptide repeats
MPTPTCAYEGCGRSVYQNPAFPETDKCIFHCEEKDPQEFNRAMELQIGEWQHNGDETWNFIGWIFNSANFQGSRFNHSVDFTDAHFVGRTNFIEREFNSRCDFANAIFDSVTFNNAVFNSDATFERSQFLGAVSFENVNFHGDAGFDSAVFSVCPIFDQVHFNGWAEFGGVVFKDGASFRKVMFENESDLSETELSGEFDFSGASFAREGNFDGANVIGRVRLIWPGPILRRDAGQGIANAGQVVFENIGFESDAMADDPILDLRDNMLRDEANFRIQNTRMGHILLSGTDCKRISWNNRSSYKIRNDAPPRRVMLGDELLRRGILKCDFIDLPSWYSIAATYQQLTGQARKDLNHPLANDFERGIFECRLMSAKQDMDWRNVILLSLYKAASNFGGSIWRPAWIALALTAVCAWLDGGILYGGYAVWPWHWDLRTGWDSLVAAMRVVSLDRSWFSREVDSNAAGSFARFAASSIALIQTVLTATLVTLFIFAVRRRFKHSE